MDIAIIWNNEQARGDWSVQNGDLALDNPLRTAIMVSLFSDRVAPDTLSSLDQAVGMAAAPDAAGSNHNDRRGWWGDAFAQEPIGSRLWQLQRAIKAGQTSTLREAEAICTEALQWLMDDGVAAAVSVTATWASTKTPTLRFSVTVTEPGSNAAQQFYYSWAWEGLT
ncbi:phage GP46 family protein [Acetobacter persici]|uniref:phage GP46 family protein n=1 Tax=Acetobacter persici TaxID=1076596 RepID=UPI0036D779C7